jgi:signal transduction histidine kinase
MQIGQRLDAIDSRIIFRAYAGLAGLAGLVLLCWGPLWLGSDLAGQPWGKAALIRVLGSILIAAACFAVPLASMPDPNARQRGLLWLSAGHAVVFLVVLTQRLTIWGPGLADWAATAPFAAALLLSYFGVTAYGDPTGEPPWSRLITLFGEPVPRIVFFGGTPPPSTRKLRSQYEQQIREAASHEERNRLARDLHDSVKQQVFVMQTAAATAQARFDDDPGGAKQALEEVRNSAREAMTEMEVMLDQLRAAPLENVGLAEALKAQGEALGFRTGARVQCEVGKLPPSDSMAPGAQQAIFRVAQEAMANVARHARARNVLISLGAVNGQFRLRIQDDGAGFNQNDSARGLGLASMRERAEEFDGKLDVSSRPGAGTSLGFSIPYAVPEPAKYLRKAAIWAVLLIMNLASAIRFSNRAEVALILLCSIVIIREIVAWRRARKQSETLA